MNAIRLVIQFLSRTQNKYLEIRTSRHIPNYLLETYFNFQKENYLQKAQTSWFYHYQEVQAASIWSLYADTGHVVTVDSTSDRIACVPFYQGSYF